jgi:hypothetical protein
MLWFHLDSVCKGTFALLVVVTACAAYAYFLNWRRPADDPEKKDYYFAAILLTPITFIPFLIIYISLLILAALFYGLALSLSILILVVFRKWFFLVWLHKGAKYIGDKSLEANTILLKLFLRPWTGEPEAI